MSGRINISFFFLKRLYGYITVLPSVRIFKIFSSFRLWKNRNKMRVYIVQTNMRNFSWNFPTFFQKLPLSYIFINCTDLWKFVIIVFNNYLNFIKLSNTSTIFWKTNLKFKYFFCKIYVDFIHNLPKFLKNFLKDFQNFPELFPNIPLFFFNFNKYYSKLIIF